MGSKIIKEHLEALDAEKKYDKEFIRILQGANEQNLDGESVAEEVIKAINARYVKSQKDNS